MQYIRAVWKMGKIKASFTQTHSLHGLSCTEHFAGDIISEFAHFLFLFLTPITQTDV